MLLMSAEEELRLIVRASVLERLSQSIDEREAASIERFIRTFDELPRPFDEDSGITHVTGSAIVVGPRGVLLHLHKRAQIWIQPGGHVDAGETPWDGAVRETWEETGLRALHPQQRPDLMGCSTSDSTPIPPFAARPRPVLIHVDVHDAPKGHVHLDLRYLLIGPDADPAPPPEESQQVGWFPFDDPLLERESINGAVRSARRWLDQHPTT